MPARTPRADMKPPGERAALIDPLRVKGPRVGPGPVAITAGVLILAGLSAGGYGWWRFVETDRTLVAALGDLDQTRVSLAQETERVASLTALLGATRDDLASTRLSLDRSRADAEMLTRRLGDLQGRFDTLERALATRAGELGRARAELAALMHERALPEAMSESSHEPPRHAAFVSEGDRRVLGEVEWSDELGRGVARLTHVADPGAGVYRFWAVAGTERELVGVITALPGEEPVDAELRGEMLTVRAPERIEVSYDGGSDEPGDALAVVAEARFDR